MKTINEVQNEIIEDFSLFEDWMGKYEYLIDMGKNLEPMPEEYKKDEYLVKGCSSRAWIYPIYKEGKLHFLADGEAVISKGFLYLLLKIFNNRNPEEIVNADLFFLERTGLKENLSPSRANGLLASINKIKDYAKQFLN